MDEVLKAKLRQAGIDVALTERCLEQVNCQAEKGEGMGEVHLPRVDDDPSVVGLGGSSIIRMERERALASLERFPSAREGLLEELRAGRVTGDEELTFTREQLTRVGTSLFSEYAYGLFNGGASSSYFDLTKNQKFSPELFELFRQPFTAWRERYAELPKGLTPAFIREEGSSPSFLELKLLSLFHLSLKAAAAGVRQRFDRPIGFFQMTGGQTDGPIVQEMARLQHSPLLSPALRKWPVVLAELPRAVQPLIAAITHSREGERRDVFLDAAGNPFALPGGHGQCFVTLKGVFQQLRQQGYRYVSLGNIDNLGYTPDAEVLALLALKGAHAAFCGAYKTAVDTKGGVIVQEPSGRFTCRDLGVSVDPSLVEQAESAGQAVLFNCAIGYFDLDYLLSQIDRIITLLPLRVSDQQKDRGHYAQMEQVTWEVIGLLDEVLIVGVEKKRRFLAAKLAMENFINSGYGVERYPESCSELRRLACELSQGMAHILNEDCGISPPVAAAS